MNLDLIKHSCIGLDVYSAKNKILSLCPELTEADIEITYKESEVRRFTVFDCALKDGKIEEQGSYEELLEKNGYFTKLYKSSKE